MKYPNLELIESAFIKAINEEYTNFFDKDKTKVHEYVAHVFPQLWGNTSTGFDINGECCDQAFVQEYTTVMSLYWCEKDDNGYWNPRGDIYGVFFGDKLAYICVHPNNKFMEDDKNHNMLSQKHAKEYTSHELFDGTNRKVVYPFYDYICGVTGLTCCGCSLFCGHREEKKNNKETKNAKD